VGTHGHGNEAWNSLYFQEFGETIVEIAWLRLGVTVLVLAAADDSDDAKDE